MLHQEERNTNFELLQLQVSQFIHSEGLERGMEEGNGMQELESGRDGSAINEQSSE